MTLAITPWLLVAGLAMAVAALAAGMIAAALGRRDQLRRRLRLVRSAAATAAAAEAGPLLRVGEWLAATPVFGGRELAKLRQDLYAAGLTGTDAVARFIGLKIVLAGLLAGLALLWLRVQPASALFTALLLLGAALAGLRGPDVVIGNLARSRRERIDRGLADALDLLVVCGEAGIGLELGLERVARELKEVHPDLAAELGVTVSEMRLLSDRIEALHNMGERVQLESVRAIAATLAQTLRYGTPLGRALRTLTADFRQARQTRMEERTARLPVLITVPMIAFILPATTLVVAGPAFLQLITALEKMQ